MSLLTFDSMADPFLHIRGRLLSYTEITADVGVTTTLEHGSCTFITAPNLDLDGVGKVLIEARIAQVQDARPGDPKPFPTVISLWRDSVNLGTLALINALEPIWAGMIVVSWKGAQRYTLRAWLTERGVASVKAGGQFRPASLRISELQA